MEQLTKELVITAFYNWLELKRAKQAFVYNFTTKPFFQIYLKILN